MFAITSMSVLCIVSAVYLLTLFSSLVDTDRFYIFIASQPPFWLAHLSKGVWSWAALPLLTCSSRLAADDVTHSSAGWVNSLTFRGGFAVPPCGLAGCLIASPSTSWIWVARVAGCGTVTTTSVSKLVTTTDFNAVTTSSRSKSQ